MAAIRILVCGDRDYKNGDLIKKIIRSYDCTTNIECIIEGGAKGADSFAREAAKRDAIDVFTYRADWDKYGLAAGPIRNRQMIKEGKPDLILAFHSNIEKSKGTLDMIKAGNKVGIKIILYP